MDAVGQFFYTKSQDTQRFVIRTFNGGRDRFEVTIGDPKTAAKVAGLAIMAF